MKIPGKIALVTSTSRGIGKGIKLPHTLRIALKCDRLSLPSRD